MYIGIYILYICTVLLPIICETFLSSYLEAYRVRIFIKNIMFYEMFLHAILLRVPCITNHSPTR